MKILQFQEFSKNLNFYNYYNLDINLNTYFAANYHKEKNESMESEQKLTTIFLDIEVYQKNKNISFRFDESEHPISAISINFENDYYCYFLHERNENLNQWEVDFKRDLIKDDYITENNNIKIFTYNNELKLISDCWEKVKELNPFVLSGFNSDNFDYPYIYRRLLKLYNNDEHQVHKLLSRFEFVEFRNDKYVEFPEFTICDLLHLYKPREDGGLNFGKKQPSYSLDFISNVELKLKKFDYKDENADLNEFYEKDPKNYLFYNLIDVILCNRLNKKLKHIELHNGIRRKLKNSFSRSLIGNSSSFDSYVLYENMKNNSFVRFGMNSESSKFIEEVELSSFPKMIDKKKIIPPCDVDSKKYGKLVSKFKGAHVNSPIPRVIKDGSLIIDLDASLPPWETIMVKRNNDIFTIEIENYNFVENDETLTWTDLNIICWKKILQKFRHNWRHDNGDLIKIVTENNREITITDNHSIYCIKKNDIFRRQQIVKGKDLEINDLLICNNITYVVLEKIISIKIIKYSGFVYDISVEDTERFFSGKNCDIGVHNSSLYPSMMLQSNISFDVYTARIINPVTYKFLSLLESRIGKQTIDNKLIQSVHDLCIKFVDDEDVKDKLDTKRNLYYVSNYLIQKLFQFTLKKSIDNIYCPKTDEEQYLLQFYLIPFLDMLSFIHPNSKPYNNFVYDYLFDEHNLENIYSHIYILEMPISTNQRILKLTVNQAIEYIKKYSLTIVGTCFEKHENKLGLFTNLLNDLFKERKFYQKEMKKYKEGSIEYDFNNSRQKTIKIIMNSIYGVLGLRVFRYSNHHLAQSITAQGQLSIKLAQYITENYLKSREPMYVDNQSIF